MCSPNYLASSQEINKKMKIKSFIAELKENPKGNTFSRTMEVIDEHYDFIPTAFNNGTLGNLAGENSGSCKIFAFAKRQQLNEELTLACFGEFYFKDVLENPNGEGHENIRNFMKTGWEGIHFKGTALEEI